MSFIFPEEPRRKPPRRLNRLSENGLLWIALLLLTIGAITTFYRQGMLVQTVGSFQIFSASGGRNNRVGDKELPVYCVETDKPKVELSFDAAWGHEETQQLMDILSKYNLKVSFL